jgi:pimeloyl-ACP methyl ester carboxylesterase
MICATLLAILVVTPSGALAHAPQIPGAATAVAACTMCAPIAKAKTSDDDTAPLTGYLDVGGGRIYYEVLGEGRPVVLIHDGMLHSEVWENQFRPFAERYRVIRYDRRGYGRSDAPTQAFSNVADLHALIKHVGAERAVLIGSSSGGGLAIDYTLAHPERVDALVLVGAVVGGLGYSTHFMDRARANRDVTFEATLERWIDDKYSVAPGNTAARARVGALLRANPHNMAIESHHYAQRPDPPALGRLNDIHVPTLLVTAEADIPDVHAHAGAIEAGISGARRVVLPRAGHLVYLEQPDLFNRTVLEFLARLGSDEEKSAQAAVSSKPPVTADETTAPPGVKTGYVKVGDAELYYEELGEGDPVVLIHGGALDCRMWDGTFETLARRFRVIRYDVRGLGRSNSPPGAYYDHGDLYALLKRLGIRKTAVVGLSLGGRIAIDFAIQHPEMVMALVPVAPGLSGYEFNGEDLKGDMASLIEAYQRQDYDRVVELFQRSWTDGPHRSPDQVDPDMREKVRAMAVRGVRGWEIQQHAVPLSPPAIGRLAEIQAPTLVIVGDLDMSDIHAIVELVMKDVPGARKAVIPGAAHMVNMEKPAEFNRVVLEFLTRP